MAEISGKALTLLTAGGIVAYAGLKGFSITNVLQSVLAGKDPSSSAVTNPITTASALLGSNPDSVTTTPDGLAVGGSAIASDAMRYLGTVPYVFGKANPQTGWDCSGFVNYVCGHDLGMQLPGLSKPGFDGQSHGPVTGQYYVSTLLTTIATGASPDAAPGDLACWPTHIGICIGNVNGTPSMINAYDDGHVTQINSLADGGPRGEALIIRRWK